MNPISLEDFLTFAEPVLPGKVEEYPSPKPIYQVHQTKAGFPVVLKHVRSGNMDLDTFVASVGGGSILASLPTDLALPHRYNFSLYQSRNDPQSLEQYRITTGIKKSIPSSVQLYNASVYVHHCLKADGSIESVEFGYHGKFPDMPAIHGAIQLSRQPQGEVVLSDKIVVPVKLTLADSPVPSKGYDPIVSAEFPSIQPNSLRTMMNNLASIFKHDQLTVEDLRSLMELRYLR